MTDDQNTSPGFSQGIPPPNYDDTNGLPPPPELPPSDSAYGSPDGRSFDSRAIESGSTIPQPPMISDVPIQVPLAPNAPSVSVIPAPVSYRAGTIPTVASAPPDISVWGLPGSGKSAFLAAAIRMLQTELYVRTPQGTRINYDVSPPYHFDITSDDRYQTANEFLTRIGAAMADGSLPSFNQVGIGMDSKPFPLLIGLPDSGDGKRGHFFTLWMMDSAGENVYDTNNNNPYWQNISRARGVLMLVNASQRTPPPKSGTVYGYSQLIANFRNKVNENRLRLPPVAGRTENQYLALCIAQADRIVPGRGLDLDIRLEGEREALAFYSPDAAKRFSESDQQMERLARFYLGGDFQLLKSMYGDRMKLFLTSAVGWTRTPNGYVSNLDPTDPRKLLDRAHWRTFGVVQALTWLFDRIEQERINLFRPDPGQQQFIRAHRRLNMDILQEYINSNPDYGYPL